MKQWKRLLFYLLLNVFVSACTTFAVLLAWDRTHPVSGGLIQFSFERRTEQSPQATQAGVAPAVVELEARPTATRVYVAYQVKEGDDIDSVAQAFGISPEELMAENGYQTKQLAPGEVLRVPQGGPDPQAATVKIESVIGAGDLEVERVLLKKDGEGEVYMAGWKLEDDQGNLFTFPDLTLLGGAVNVYTRSGNNTVVDLYWGQSQAVWQSGKTVTLRDALGVARDTYPIP